MRRIEHLLSIPLLAILASALIACGDNEPDEAAPEADTGGVAEQLPQYDTTYDPNNEEAFEEMIFKQHAHLMARVPKGAIDSVMKATLLAAKDRSSGKAAAEKGMKALMARQDSIVRASIAAEFGISLDSIEAIMQEEKGEQGEQEETKKTETP
jgi:hypothetical protein